MNVGVITAYSEPIGFNYGILKFCQLVPAYGVNAVIIALTRQPRRSNHFIEEAQRLGLHIEMLHEEYRYDPGIFGGLVKIVDRRQLDLLDLQTYKPLILGLFARRCRPNLSLVSWVHGFTKENLKIKLFGMAEQRLHRFADKTVCVSRSFSEMLLRRGMNRKKVVVIPNAIDENHSNPADSVKKLRDELRLGDATVVVGAMGRLSPEKGHTILLKAWAQISRLLPMTRLVIVGDGPCMSALQREAKQLEVEDSVLFTGFRPDGRQFYSIFNLMVLPSYEEGLPYVLLESMIDGVPVVASSVGEVPDVLQNGKLGRLVPPGDASSLARGILTLLKNPHEASVLAENARVHVRAQYSQEVRTRQIVEVYNGTFQDRLRH